MLSMVLSGKMPDYHRGATDLPGRVLGFHVRLIVPFVGMHWNDDPNRLTWIEDGGLVAFVPFTRGLIMQVGSELNFAVTSPAITDLDVNLIWLPWLSWLAQYESFYRGHRSAALQDPQDAQHDRDEDKASSTDVLLRHRVPTAGRQ